MDLWLPGLVILLALMLAGVPIAFAMAIVGYGGAALIVGWQPALHMLAQVTFDTGLSYTLSVVPLFILMGNLVNVAGLSDELYAAAHAWLGHRRGGLALATCAACAGFSAVCGSSLATAATMARVAMPPMRRYGYADSLAAGVIAAGGTLGILIPPSVILVLYGIMTQQDIGKLFIAGIVPGLVGMLGYMLAVHVMTTLRPELGPRAEPLPWPQRWRALRGVGGMLALFALVIGGIYFGIFTATEAAGIGAGGALLFALFRRALSFQALYRALSDAARTTAMMFTVLIGALLFANFINLAGLPDDLTRWVQAYDLSPYGVLALILLIYLLLGAVLESLSMVLLTVPIFFPLVQALGFDPLWFGIIVVVMTEISLITPPVGLNVFVLKAVLPDVGTGTVFRGVLPFIVADIGRIVLLILLPGLVTFLPASLGR